MDGIHMEPCHRLHEDQFRVQALLRGTHGEAASCMIFVNSMSDLFHRDVPAAFIDEIFFTMNEARWHCFQVLTKRAGRLAQLSGRLKWTANIWMGVTVENSPVHH